MNGYKSLLIRLGLVLLPLALTSIGAQAQTVTNQGSMIYMAPHSLVTVNGTFNVNSAGIVVAEDSSTLSIDGTLNISNGSVSLNNSAYALVTQDLTTGGTCGSPTGRLLRNAPGTLDIRGYLTNKGDGTNFSIINIGKDWVNDGTFNNKPGALITIDP